MAVNGGCDILPMLYEARLVNVYKIACKLGIITSDYSDKGKVIHTLDYAGTVK